MRPVDIRGRARTVGSLALLLVAFVAVTNSSGTAGSNSATVRDAQLTAATSTSTFQQASWVDTVGPIALSSPTVATIDDVEAVAFGSEDGELYVVDAATGANLPGWPQQVRLSGAAPTAIESSPTVAYLDGPSKPPSIIVGVGSTYVADQQGGLVAFNENGTVRFTFHTKDTFNEWSGAKNPAPIGYDNGVFSTPAIGDLTGNGQQDIVFGAWDHDLYALTSKGTLVAGFPIDTEDTIWSSPALAHVRGSATEDDIFVGGDATGRRGCYGGFVYDVTYVVKKHAPKIAWQHCENQTIWSSPAVGVINSTGRLAVVVGTGYGEPPPYKSDTDKVFAFYAKSGATVPGWPVATAGPTFGSPAIGLVDTTATPVVVDTSWCTACAASPGTSMVYAWNGDGTALWSQSLQGAQDFASPILVDLTGSGENDVVVGSASGLFPLDGATGDFLFGTSSSQAINTCSEQGTPAVADVPETGWQLFESCGGPHELIATGRLFDYPLPTAPATTPPWPMWRQNPAHDGFASP